MFLAAAPYFQYRFAKSDWVVQHFQPAIIVSSSLVNLSSMLILARMQKDASYPHRVVASLILSAITFSLLTISSVTFRGLAPNGYFAFVLVMVAVSSFATALAQNGLFSLSSGFGREEYTQAIMAGQGIAGVLPCIVQIISVLSVPGGNADSSSSGDPSKSAFGYFATATSVSLVALFAFGNLMRHHNRVNRMRPTIDTAEDEDTNPHTERKEVGLTELFWKLKWFASGIFFTFGLSMLFPVFAQQITSVQPEATAPRIFHRDSFIPLALLLWNAGDLTGRWAPLIPALNLTQSPKTVTALSLARVLFIPLYFLCNIKGRGALIESDLFYLIVVQFLFGLTNGWLGSICMMAAPEWVDKPEREAAGSFMGLLLVSGLTAGSFLSFAVA